MSDDVDSEWKAASKEWDELPDPCAATEASKAAYAKFWEIENWLRRMVYLEVRARQVDWRAALAQDQRSMTNDKALTHMTTADESPITYMTTGGLKGFITADANWGLFERYFPPKRLLETKLDELLQIRHRVAHFRRLNLNDVARLSLFVEEFESGVRAFAVSLSAALSGLAPGQSDPVATGLATVCQDIGTIEMNSAATGWIFATHRRQNPAVGVAVNHSLRPWGRKDPTDISLSTGLLYHVKLMGIAGSFSIPELLRKTESAHEDCVFIRLESPSTVEIVLAACLGVGSVVATTRVFMEVASELYRPHRDPPGTLTVISRESELWPEYVLAPGHPLGFVEGEMNGRIVAPLPIGR